MQRLDELAELGVAYLAAYPDRSGLIGFGTKGWNSWQDPITVAAWISRVLDREADVADKLQRHGGRERHALIWATLGSTWAVSNALNWHKDAPPLRKPIGPEIDEEFWDLLLGPQDQRPQPAPLPDPSSQNRSHTYGSPAPSPVAEPCTKAPTADGSEPTGAPRSTKTTSTPQ